MFLKSSFFISLFFILGCGDIKFKDFVPDIKEGAVEDSKVLHTENTFESEEDTKEESSFEELQVPQVEEFKEVITALPEEERISDPELQQATLEEEGILTEDPPSDAKEVEVSSEGLQNDAKVVARFDIKESEKKEQTDSSFIRDENLEIKEPFKTSERKNVKNYRRVESEEDLHTKEKTPSHRELSFEFSVESSSDLEAEVEGKEDHTFYEYDFFEMKEIFIQKGQTKADILVVADNSASMADDHKNMAEKMGEFFEEMEGLDWRLGVITTDQKKEKGSLKRFSDGSSFITDETPNYHNEFTEVITQHKWCVLCTANMVERPLSALIDSFSNEKNKDFFRKDSRLIIIFITDEDEKYSRKKPRDVLHAVKSIFGEEKPVTIHGVLSLRSGDGSCLQEKTRRSSKVKELVEKVGGLIYDICSDDYGSILKNIAKTSAADFRSKFQLSKEPLIETLEVTILPEDDSLNWVLGEGNVLEFEIPPKKGSRITVRYRSLSEKRY